MLTSISLVVPKDMNEFLVKDEKRSTGSIGKKPGSEVDFVDLGEEKMVLEDSEEEDAEECEQDVSGTTDSDSQAPFLLVDCVQIDKEKFAMVLNPMSVVGDVQNGESKGFPEPALKVLDKIP
ncbi:hypothetical protein U1Q18_017963 [Sarracenia purpurea var. burkii]